MFRLLKQKRLAARGLSCGKTRLAPTDGQVRNHLEGSLPVRIAVLLLASAVLAFYCFAGTGGDPVRNLLYALLILALAVVQSFASGDTPARGNSRLTLFLAVILLQLGIGELLQALAGQGRLDSRFLPLVLPYALAPLTLSVLLGARAGISACVAGSLWWAVLSGGASSPLLMSLAGGLAAVLSTARVRRRSRLLRAGLHAGIATSLLGLITGLVGPVDWSSPASADWWMVVTGIAVTTGSGILTAVLVSGSLPLLERGFGITTEISWLEMADLNNPLLRRLSMEAPGTYHHSLAVANLAEACAEKTGANPTLCRVSAYFHDIGKLVKPEYFAENMPPGRSPHDDLTPTMSAIVILSHVKEGVDLALRNKLNRRIVDAISQHHGTTLVEYFYQRARRQELDARTGGSLMNVRQQDIPKVSEETYRYPGPKPRSLETVILGLSDAAESASRSLERPTVQRLDDLVHDILQERISDGQYDEAPVTMLQLQDIADTLVTCLASMHHTRIAYAATAGAGDDPEKD